MDWRFVVRTRSGRPLRGVLVADTETEARNQLLAKGVHVLHLRAATGPLARLEIWIARMRPLRLTELAATTRQMATLLNAGVGVIRALDVVNDQPLSPRMGNAWADVSLSVQKGNALSRSMARHPDVFDGLYRGLVKAGESSGALVANLARLADVLERELRLRQKLAAALTYPAFTCLICVAATFILTQKILPTFITGLFRDTAMRLPWMTRSVIFVTDLMNSKFFFYGIVPGTVVALYLMAGYLRTPSGRYRADWIAFHTPVLKDVFIKASCARFCRTLSCLLKCGVPLVYSLELVDMVLSNFVLSRHLQQMRAGLEEGKALHHVLREVPLFPPLLCGFAELGETTGHLPKLFERLADMLDEELELSLETATNMLEPLMVMLLGLLVGYVVVAMFLPMYQILSAF